MTANRISMERLSEENERLKDRCAGYSEDVTSLNGCMARLEAALYEARDEAAKRRAEVERMRDALRKLLLSRDAAWTGGHDWQEAVDDAVKALGMEVDA